jgi:hypothetical protein
LTIIVAGYESEEGISKHKLLCAFDNRATSGDDALLEEKERRTHYLAQLERPKRAYVIADSLLSRKASSGRDAIADTAEKITPVDLILSIPEFLPYGRPSGKFREYQCTSCGVAFAGATALQTLTLDKFRSLAGRLRYTWVSGDGHRTGHYAICQSGSPEDLIHPSKSKIEYGNSIDFAYNELPPLQSSLVLQTFIDAFEMALNDHVVKEAWNRQSEEDMPVDGEFVLLTYCEQDRAPAIYSVDYFTDKTVFPSCFKARGKKLEWDQLAVLGMPSMKERLALAREMAIEAAASIADPIAQCVGEILDAHASKNFVGGRVRRGMLKDQGFSIEP